MTRKKKDKTTKIYLTPLGRIVALGECSLRAAEEGISLDEYLKKEEVSGNE